MNFTFSASYVALWAVVAFQGLLVLAVLRQLAELRRLMNRGVLPGEHWLPPGSRAPEFGGHDVHSGDFVSSGLFDGRGGMILFLSPGCTVCKALAQNFQFQPFQGANSPVITAICCNGDTNTCADFGAGLGVNVRLLLDQANEIGARYRVSRFPTAVVVDKEEKIRAYGYPQSVKDLKQLLEHSVDKVQAQDGPGQTSAENHTQLSLTPGESYENH